MTKENTIAAVENGRGSVGPLDLRERVLTGTPLENKGGVRMADDSDSSHQSLAVSLAGATLDGTSITGSDGVDVFFSGKALRELLYDLAVAGVL